MAFLRSFVSLVVSVGWVAACSGSTEGSGGAGLGDGSVGGNSGYGSGTAGNSGSGTGAYGGQTLAGIDASVVNQLCGGGGCICSNGIDDDNDGFIDGFDVECTGPLDNDEGTFATGIPGDNVDPKWQDCFFDGDSGAGNDGCRYHTDCLTGAKPQSDPACQVTDQCLKMCKPLVPNGCDCFGCCTVSSASGDVTITIGSTCSLEQIGDQNACPRCEKSTMCGNPCETCELCPGKTVDDLPASCTPNAPDGGSYTDAAPPPSYTCGGGQVVCVGQSDCGENQYCSLGCCVDVLR